MAKDKYHNLVKEALEAEGWLVTDDPYYIPTLKRRLQIDLGAERVLAAERGSTKIAVEIKSFIGLSAIHDFYKALGQFNYYYEALEDFEAERILFLAVPETVYEEFFSEPLSQKLVKKHDIKLIVYSIEKEDITQWIA